jgi:hypothetical protein
VGPNGASQVSRGWSFREMNDELLSVVRDGALHGKATVGASREGHGGLQREADSSLGLRKSQGGAWG